MQELLDGLSNSRNSSLQSKLTAVLSNSYERLPSHAHRLMFLDAALLLRGRPPAELAALWEGQLLLDDDKGKGPFGRLPERQRGEALVASQVCQQTNARKRASKLLEDLERLQLVREEPDPSR